MAQLENLNSENVGALRECFEEKIKTQNPSAMLTVGPQDDLLRMAEHKVIAERLSVLESKLDSLTIKIDNVFGEVLRSVKELAEFIDWEACDIKWLEQILSVARKKQSAQVCDWCGKGGKLINKTLHKGCYEGIMNGDCIC